MGERKTAERAGAARPLTVALLGNPNVGKTTIFNALTGTYRWVGNYPGVTVEKDVGSFLLGDREVRLVDLPGTYSLTARSEDERVARRFLLDERPDLVIDVVDASNLERNLYLAVQVMELGVPLVLVLNKSDLARRKGLELDLEHLQRLFRVRIVPTVGSDGRGIDELRQAVLELVARGAQPPVKVTYGREVEAELAALEPAAAAVAAGTVWPARWLALKLLERDPELAEAVRLRPGGAALQESADHAAERVARHFGDRAEIVVADQRYGFISGACQEAVHTTVEARHSMSDRIDEVVTSPVFGVPIFLGMMYLLFKATFTLGAPPMGWIEQGVAWLSATVTGLWPAAWPATLLSLLVDGIIGGVGGVLTFLPNIVFLFVGIALLEDSGYMARGAFIADRFMHRVGLHGRSFIPAMIAFGCTVPAILATRTLESRRDRLTTMLVLPLISCGARFPIYALFTAAFFPAAWRARILMSLYLAGIIMALVLARVLRLTLLRGETSLFVMELPPYRMPTGRAILRHTWERTRQFLRKAATLIVAASAILWVLMNFPRLPAESVGAMDPAERQAAELAHSAAGRIGRAMEPVMAPVGFDWKTTTALIGAFAAKEIFVAQLGIVHALGEEHVGQTQLAAALRRQYSRLQAFCIMLFCLISMPCVATIGATRAESGSWGWALGQLVGLTALAYAVTFVVFQVGTLLGG